MLNLHHPDIVINVLRRIEDPREAMRASCASPDWHAAWCSWYPGGACDALEAALMAPQPPENILRFLDDMWPRCATYQDAVPALEHAFRQHRIVGQQQARIDVLVDSLFSRSACGFAKAIEVAFLAGGVPSALPLLARNRRGGKSSATIISVCGMVAGSLVAAGNEETFAKFCGLRGDAESLLGLALQQSTDMSQEDIEVEVDFLVRSALVSDQKLGLGHFVEHLPADMRWSLRAASLPMP
jgi:hypothetical protein